MMCWFFFQISPNWKTLHVATMHLNVFTTNVTIQWCTFPVSNHSISPKALLLLHFTTSVTIQCSFVVFPVSNHSISPKALLLLYFTTSVTIQCCFPVSNHSISPKALLHFTTWSISNHSISTVATTHFTTVIQCCFPVFPVSNHSISPKALLLLRISPLVWRSSAVFLFQTILSHQKHCCYYASPPVWRSNEVFLFSLFQTILSHQKHFSPKALLLLRISPPVWRSGAVFPVLNHSISPKALLLLHFTTSVTIQCCFPCFKPFYLTKSTVATAFHYQCDDPVLFSCFKPFYLTKSTVATTHFTTSVTIQCCFPVFPVSNHSISPKALLLLHFTTSVTIQCSSAVSLFQTILSHQKHCCYYAFHHECDDPVQFCCFPVSNHSISPKALLLLRISPPVWRSSAVLLFQTILSYCCYCIPTQQVVCTSVPWPYT